MAAKKEVAIDAIEKAKKALVALPSKEPAKKSLDEALKELKPSIELLLERGYTRAEVVEQLVKQGIPAKLYHLRTLLSTPRAASEEGNPASATASASDVEKSANSASDTGSTGSAVSSSPTSNPSSGEAVPMFQTNKSGAPVRPAAAPPTGSGASASIGGSGNTLDETASRLNDFMKQQAAPKRPTTREALGNANHHVAQEKASTSVSVNVNASD